MSNIGVTQNTPAGNFSLRKLLLNITLLIVMMIALSQGITQYFAASLGYHPSLSGLITDQWYMPHQWIHWAFAYHEHYPMLTRRMVWGFTLGTAVILILYAVLLLLIRRKAKAVDGLHGSAQWADESDIRLSGLLPKKKRDEAKGVYVGAWRDPKGKTHYLRHNGPEHMLAFAPTRSGKGVGLVLPTLLSYTESVIVYDLKGENFALTAGWRKHHANNIILKFDPTDPVQCARFNPLAEIRLGEPEEIKDAQNIAGMIADPDGKGLNDHWAKTSYALLTTLILHICYVRKAEGKTANMGDIETILTSTGEDVDTIFEEMATYQHTSEGCHPVVNAGANKMLGTPDKERGSIISTALSFLELYKDPIVKHNVSESHWCINDLMNHENPVSLYLVIPPSDRDRLLPLIRLMVTMITKKLTERMDFENGRSVAHYKHRLLMLLDEFASMKRLSAVEDALSFSAGYGVRFYLIIQDVDQITKNDMYGKENGLIGNCHIKMAYAPNNQNTADLLSKMTGTSTVIKEQITESGKKHGFMMTGVSRSYNETQRPLMTADEVSRIPKPQINNGKLTSPGRMLVFAAGNNPIYGEQILYFLDPVFLARAKVAPPTEPDTRLIPKQEEKQQEPEGEQHEEVA